MHFYVETTFYASDSRTHLCCIAQICVNLSELAVRFNNRLLLTLQIKVCMNALQASNGMLISASTVWWMLGEPDLHGQIASKKPLQWEAN